MIDRIYEFQAPTLIVVQSKNINSIKKCEIMQLEMKNIRWMGTKDREMENDLIINKLQWNLKYVHGKGQR